MGKLCKDCKHYATWALGVAVCLHQKNKRISLVDGTEGIKFSCEHLRESTIGCGGNAAWFEERK